jgi:hypothetical protein
MRSRPRSSSCGLANVETIAATPGIDGLYIGPSDLTIAVGGAGLADSSVAEAAPVHIHQAREDNGIAAGLRSASPPEAQLAKPTRTPRRGADYTHAAGRRAPARPVGCRSHVTYPRPDAVSLGGPWLSATSGQPTGFGVSGQ